MNNPPSVNILKISKRILYRFFPVWIVYTLITALYFKQDWGIFGFVSTLIGMLILPVIMYICAIPPLMLFKNISSVSRRILMVFICLIVAGLVTYVYVSILNYYSVSADTISKELIYAIMNCLFYVIIASWFFFIEEKQYITETKIIAEQNMKIINEKKVAETYLKLLQAQIEPHFLFNTLTSILVLSEKEPNKAKIMHNNFMQYLKATLAKTRTSVTTIGQDIELIKAYLDIFKVRMEDRMQYSIEADSEAIDLPFPSMLIQPIVENAIKHGLEPDIEGGKIRIKVTKQEGDRLCWEIEDTGIGMSDKADMGTGLSNIIERMEILYGKEGHFSIKDNKPSGVKVTLEVPYTYA